MSGEEQLLTEIAFESKAYWGYEPGVMEQFRAELTVHRRDLDEYDHYVIMSRSKIVGFYALDPIDTEKTDLKLFFVDPRFIGKGIGRSLMTHACQTAGTLGHTKLQIESDPNATIFYKKMGATLVGQAPSLSIPDRYLPLLEIEITR